MWAVRFCPSAPYFEPGTLFRAFSFSAGSARKRCSEARPRAALPERLCLSAEGQIFPRTSLPPAPELKNSSETHTRLHLRPAARKKAASPPARIFRLSARLPRTALHASHGVMAAPPHARPLLPQSRPDGSLSRRLPALPCVQAGRPPRCGSRRIPAALSPAPCPSALLPHACCPRFPPRSFSPLLPLCAIPSALVTPFPLRCTPPPRAAPRFRRAPPTRRREAATAKAAAASLRQKGRKE